MIRSVILALILLIVAAGCRPTKTQRPDSKVGAAPDLKTAPAEPVPIVDGQQADPIVAPNPFAKRVVKASARQIDLIQAVLKKGFTIRPESVYAVRSSNHARAFYVVTRVYGLGLDDSPPIAAWFITGEPDRPGIIQTADPQAVTWSYDDLPRGWDTPSEAWHTDRDCGSLMNYVYQMGFQK